MPVYTLSEYEKLNKAPIELKHLSESIARKEGDEPVIQKDRYRVMHPDHVHDAPINGTIELFGMKLEIKWGFVEVDEDIADQLVEIGWQKGKKLDY
jgi:hypothetical protein